MASVKENPQTIL